MRFCAVTANCANATLGKDSCESILNQMRTDNLDFSVVNFQEMDNVEGLNELNLYCNGEYSVTPVAFMVTKTKLTDKNARDRNTGIASFIIHKKEIQINHIIRQKVRRNPSKFSLDYTGYNKEVS